jgi:serine/threonine protein kinase
MPSPEPSSSTAADLVAAQRIIVANGWSGADRVQAAVDQIQAESQPPASLARALVDRQIINREQAAELDQILTHQNLFPRYRLMRRIGSGGMGMVYLAEHDGGRQVAFKSINARLATDDDFISRFHRETTVLLGIRHPHVAEVIESGEAQGHVFLAMEYISGPSLMQLLKERKVLSEAFALRVARQIALGLHHVYTGAGLIHRDLKPENILLVGHVDADGELSTHVTAKLIDFGLVKSNRDDDRLTQTGMTIGTPLYMSPEQIRGEGLDGRSDIYGLGATLYHLLTGMTPFTGNSPGAIMSAHLTEPVPDPGRVVPGLSKATRQLTMMAMAKRAEDRYATGEAMAMACTDILHDLDGGTGTERIQFLKRPLVLKQPSPSRRVETPAGADKPITTRIVEKAAAAKFGNRPVSDSIQHAVNRRPGSVGTDRSARPSSQGVPRPPTTAVRPRSEPVHRPASDRLPARERPIGSASAALERISASPLPASRPAPLPSAASGRSLPEEPDDHHGIGVAPWLFLGAGIVVVAVIALIALR